MANRTSKTPPDAEKGNGQAPSELSVIRAAGGRPLLVSECRVTLQACSLILPGAVNTGEILRIEIQYEVGRVTIDPVTLIRNHQGVPLPSPTLLEVMQPPQEPLF